jgi:hypothetical protein
VNGPETDAGLLFLPWVRRGAAAAVLAPDTLGANQAGLATATASLQINAGPSATVPVTVMGPGHVTSLDTRQVIRTDPAPGSRTFESNYLPLVELDEPSLPWLFTPASADAQARLRPWLCLVVVRKQAGVRLDPPLTGTLPVLRISGPARPATELPDLAESWAWAHASVTTAAGTSQADLVTEMADNPERSVARLLCPRVLQPDTDYLACVVPTFELGRKAGLGLDITADDEARLAPAWDQSAAAVELPVYYTWEFATGAGGDFQSLALLLRARSLRTLPPGIGAKQIDVSRSGLQVEIPGGTTLPLSGALFPLDMTSSGWADPDSKKAWEDALTPVLNAPATITATQDPLLAPPLYGATQAGLAGLDATQPHRWFEHLNLDPTYRAIAHLGARVVQANQDALMASAWAQAADLARVNQLLRQVQFGAQLTDSMHARHLARMDPGVGLQVLAPAQMRVARSPAASQFVAMLHDTGLATSAYATALRRVARPRGAINRRLQRVAATQDVTARTDTVLLNLQPVALQHRHIAFPSTRVSLETVGSRLNPPRFDLTWGGASAAAVTEAAPAPWFAFVPMGTPVPIRHPPGVPPGNWPDSPAAAQFRTLAAAQLARFNPQRSIPGPPPLLDGTLTAAFAQALTSTAPAASFAARARAVLSIPGPTRDDTTALDRVNLAPYFPRPMVEALTEIAQDLVLPGLDLVPPNTVVPLGANLAFVEAYLVGLNTEMARELLWREYPADPTATYFDRFWNAAVAPGRPPDIPPIATWGTRALGAAISKGDQFVMLIRSELLRRYPDAVIYASKQGQESDPIFTGGFAPDVRYIGFDIPAAEISDWSFVIQEHPSAPRFGVEVGTDPGTASHLSPAGPNAGQTAQHLRQMPVRLTIPATVLLGTSE